MLSLILIFSWVVVTTLSSHGGTLDNPTTSFDSLLGSEPSRRVDKRPVLEDVRWKGMLRSMALSLAWSRTISPSLINSVANVQTRAKLLMIRFGVTV